MTATQSATDRSLTVASLNRNFTEQPRFNFAPTLTKLSPTSSKLNCAAKSGAPTGWPGTVQFGASI